MKKEKVFSSSLLFLSLSLVSLSVPALVPSKSVFESLESLTKAAARGTGKVKRAVSLPSRKRERREKKEREEKNLVFLSPLTFSLSRLLHLPTFHLHLLPFLQHLPTTTTTTMMRLFAVLFALLAFGESPSFMLWRPVASGERGPRAES